MSNISYKLRAFYLTLLLPVALLADLSQSPVLSSGQTLNLDTGAIAASGGDIKFNGTSISFVGNATTYNEGNLGLGGFSLLNEATLQAVGPIYNQTAITGSALVVNDVFAVFTNAGHYAKVLITAVSSSSITLQFTTYGATGRAPSGAPVITKIQNNYSNIVAGLPNYGIAPSSLFVIYGSGLANPTAQAVLQSSVSPGIPLTLNGASITVTVNGVVTHPGIYYAIAGQIAAVLPAATPVGTGTITVTYSNLTSAAATIQVVQSALGFDTLSGLTNGTGVATDPFTGVLFTFTHSASPGQIIVLWGSGLGADPDDSDTVLTGTPHSVNVPLTLYIGGIAVQAGYAGSAGYPGVNQINVTIPANVTPGCAVPITGVVGTVVSNTITLPVAVGGGVCTDVVHGTDGNGLTTNQNQTTYTSATLGVAQDNTVKLQSAFVSAAFLKDTNVQYAPGYGLVTVGGCLVLQGSTPGSTVSYLDAGNLTITGAGGTLPITKTVSSGIIAYELNLPTGYFGSSGGSYTLAGNGGTDVGPFSVTVTDNSPLVWTNQSAITAVNRSQGVTVTWTGGIPGTYVAIGGGSTNISVSATFLCFAPVSAGTFTVPPYVLLATPVANGGINLLNQSNPVTFSAAGINYTEAVAEVEDTISVPFN